MERIDVSPEMVTFVGQGEHEPHGLPPVPLTLGIRLGAVPTLTVGMARPAGDVICYVAQHACDRIFDRQAIVAGSYHLPAELRSLALTIRDCGLASEARTTLRLAKSIELLCAIFAAAGAGELVRADAQGTLSELDTRRIVLARRLIDERWNEKLTLAGIAQAAGTNRAKLTRGFRTTFGLSVADAIAERRLRGARDMLLTTDLPVSSVGYACGYQNNASFTRAFARRFGVVPTRLRAGGVAV